MAKKEFRLTFYYAEVVPFPRSKKMDAKTVPYADTRGDLAIGYERDPHQHQA